MTSFAIIFPRACVGGLEKLFASESDCKVAWEFVGPFISSGDRYSPWGNRNHEVHVAVSKNEVLLKD